MAEKFVQKANQKMEKKGTKGDFKAWVKENMKGKDTCAAAASIMDMDEKARKKKYGTKVVKMANFAHNTCGMKKSGRTKGSATAMKSGPGGKGAKGALDSARMRGDMPEKPKSSDSGLTDKQKTLPPFLKEKIQQAKQKRAGKKEERQARKEAKKEAKKK